MVNSDIHSLSNIFFNVNDPFSGVRAYHSLRLSSILVKYQKDFGRVLDGDDLTAFYLFNQDFSFTLFYSNSTSI